MRWDGGGTKKEGKSRKGGNYKDDMMMGDLVATTEVSYLKGIESIVFQQLIFQRLFMI